MNTLARKALELMLKGTRVQVTQAERNKHKELYKGQGRWFTIVSVSLTHCTIVSKTHCIINHIPYSKLIL